MAALGCYINSPCMKSPTSGRTINMLQGAEIRALWGCFMNKCFLLFVPSFPLIALASAPPCLGLCVALSGQPSFPPLSCLPGPSTLRFQLGVCACPGVVAGIGGVPIFCLLDSSISLPSPFSPQGAPHVLYCGAQPQSCHKCTAEGTVYVVGRVVWCTCNRAGGPPLAAQSLCSSSTRFPILAPLLTSVLP